MRPRELWERLYGDFLVPSSLPAYRQLLEHALELGYEIVPVETFWHRLTTRGRDPTGPCLVLRHDVDADPRTAAEMWAVERDLGVVSSYYFRLSTVDLGLIADIGRAGGEVGYHFEELATLLKARRVRGRAAGTALIPEAQELFGRDLERLRSETGLPMRVVASHGDFVNRRVGLPNWSILVDRRVRQRYGIDLEVYDEALVRAFSSRHSDSRYPRRWVPGDLVAALEARGSSVYALVHPGNWRSRRGATARDDLVRLTEEVAYDIPRPRRRRTTDGRSSGPPEAVRPGPARAAQPFVPGPTRSGAPSPPLIVTAPPTRLPERRYVLDVVLREWLGLSYRLLPCDRSRVAITLGGDTTGRSIELPDVLLSTPDPEWLTERSLPATPIRRVALGGSWLDGDTGEWTGEEARGVPAVFPGAGPPPDLLVRETPAGLAFGVDALGAIFYLLSGYEELARPYVDDHDRYPCYASLAFTEGFLERPIVDEYVAALRLALLRLWPGLPVRPEEFRLVLTHDVDQPWAALGHPATGVLRTSVGDVLLRHDPVLAARRAAAIVPAARGVTDPCDPLDTFDLLMDTSERSGLRSTFYVQALDRVGGRNGAYRLSDPPIGRLLRRIHERGHEIGLHASYGSSHSAETTIHEAEELRRACAALGFEQQSWGVRQHYLRFETPGTWRNHERAGLAHDSTFGFADHVGFRAGTGREYTPWDLVARRPLALRERPVVVMDATLLGYDHLPIEDAITRGAAIVNACRRHRVPAVVLVHNSSVAGTRLRARYRELIAELART
ncbi:MAG TPA: hypothetical protein VFS32_01475 [Candidatus Limnocylindrales bacterium]|nr:hypothetical protein [Candidatus Limnocylindrales bacterium]